MLDQLSVRSRGLISKTWLVKNLRLPEGLSERQILLGLWVGAPNGGLGETCLFFKLDWRLINKFLSIYGLAERRDFPKSPPNT